MIWWYWMLIGLVLLGAEMLTPGGFYILFFGLAALIVGSLTGLGFTQAEWIQWLLFSALAILSLLVFRGPLLAWIKTRDKEMPTVDSMVGESAILLEDLVPGGTVKAALRGNVVIDLRNIYQPADMVAKGFHYVSIGRPSRSEPPV
jgi:hypothetical protein